MKKNDQNQITVRLCFCCFTNKQKVNMIVLVHNTIVHKVTTNHK